MDWTVTPQSCDLDAFTHGTATRDATCTPCQKEGHVAPQLPDPSTSSTCSTCDVGYGSTDGENCVKCEHGTYNNVLRSPLSVACADKHCPFGQGVVDVNSTTTHTCEPCVYDDVSQRDTFSAVMKRKCQVCDGNKFAADDNGDHVSGMPPSVCRVQLEHIKVTCRCV